MIGCPACGEDEDLEGRTSGEVVVLACGARGNSWERDTRPTCRLCGSSDVEAVATATLTEAGRGGVRTPSGIRASYNCWSCSGADVTSTRPRPGPNPPPGSHGDLRSLRG